MIGEKLGEDTGKTTGRRVLSVDGGPVIETSGTGTGTMLGVQYHSFVTYTGKMQADGTIAGEGIGVMMGKGGENASFTAKGVGRLLPAGGVSWRGAFFFQTTATKWTRLNSIATLFEVEID